MLLLKDTIAFGREEPADLLHRTRCRPMVLTRSEALKGPEAVRILLCGLTPRPSLGPLSALSTISSSHHAHPSMPLLAKIEHRWQKPDKGKLLLLRFCHRNDNQYSRASPTPAILPSMVVRGSRTP